jgi:hypothetical protein
MDMKRNILIALLIPLLALLAAQNARAEVGVAITVGEPGFYGQIVLGDVYPAPVLIYPEPIIIDHSHPGGRPMYLHVPPGHAKDWRKHCRHYNACGYPVYFVQTSWYDDVYVPTYRQQHGNGGKGKNKGKNKGNGQGNGQGNGKGKHR